MGRRFIKISGWQSWSPPKNSFFKLPFFLYPPFKVKSRLSKYSKAKLKKPAYGWCTWYPYGTNINSKKIIKNLNWISNYKNIPLEYLLIDDGWTTWGDWKKPDKIKFPEGLFGLFNKIKSKKIKPGIWIAPFLVDEKSKILTKNPDWIIKPDGKPFNPTQLHSLARFTPIKKCLLDLKNPKVKKYVYESIDYLLKKLKADLLKIDFIYAVYFDKRLSKPEADKIVSDFLDYIKKKYPNVYTIASGCPFEVAVDKIDSIRTGPDTLIDPFFGFKVPAFFRNFFITNKVIPAINSRLSFKNFWNIDPDAFVCSKTLKIKDEVVTKLSNAIKQSGGNIFLGDDLTKLKDTEVNKFILPLFGQHPEPKI